MANLIRARQNSGFSRSTASAKRRRTPAEARQHRLQQAHKSYAKVVEKYLDEINSVAARGLGNTITPRVDKLGERVTNSLLRMRKIHLQDEAAKIKEAEKRRDRAYKRAEKAYNQFTARPTGRSKARREQTLDDYWAADRGVKDMQQRYNDSVHTFYDPAKHGFKLPARIMKKVND